MSRQRTTWAADHTASAPPATPGYNVEDKDHPAHQPDPAYADYKKGDPSAWAEDPKTPPYPQGNPPSTPGYDVEDKDHPAHKEMPRVEKMNPKGASLRDMVEKRADKCIRLARHMLGKGANAAMVEDQALDLMDLPEDQLEASLARLGGNPMVAAPAAPAAPVAEPPKVADDLLMDDDLGLMDDDLMDMPMDDGMDMMIPDDDGFDMDGILAKLGELTEQVKSMKKAGKKADQNDPKGKTLAPGSKSEEQVRAEGAATTNLQQEKTARAMFASMDMDQDGFLMAEDWSGNKSMFAAIDVDADGIISADEFVASMTPTAACACGAPMADGLDPEDAALLAEMEMESAKVAKKAEDGEEAPAEETEDKEAPAEETEDKDKAEEASKKATDEAAMFGLQGDPMGLTDINASTDEDKAVLASIFGKTAEDDEPAEEKAEKEEEEAEGEEAAKKAAGTPPTAEQRTAAAKQQRTAAQRPQGRKPSQGVRTVGTMTRTAATGNDVDELSKLWQSDPDVSEVFGR